MAVGILAADCARWLTDAEYEALHRVVGRSHASSLERQRAHGKTVLVLPDEAKTRLLDTLTADAVGDGLAELRYALGIELTAAR